MDASSPSSRLSLKLPKDGFVSQSLAFDPPLIVSHDAGRLRVTRDGRQLLEIMTSSGQGQDLALHLSGSSQTSDVALSALFEALFTCNPMLDRVEVHLDDESLTRQLLQHGLLIEDENRLLCRPEMLFQCADLWLGDSGPAFPALPVIGKGVVHPLRPPKPEGRVYARFIPWLGKVLSFHVADVEADLPHFHRWMNDPRVSAIWEDQGDLAYHQNFIESRLADPRTLPLIGAFDGKPFGYFELYWAKEDRIGPYYDADDHDRGWHVAIGEDDVRGKAFVSAWLPSLMHYMFLADARTGRIVGEPIHHHSQQIKNLDRSGFAKIKHIDFPHKKALLVMLLREKFFMDRLLFPDLTGLDGEPAPCGSLPRQSAA
ncbi:acetyltransferase [Allorhizobium sp. BGMRC 0089]|uniref:GNAT family N-acetyltransferase n=1 Tax=Allorhizobium sonneratiae TaxID=2934936 RepID=UPI002033FE1E|nr:GNAT family N-acetyltransferase [Allorhizobium sonneratiae]MCM2293117.1 acetyltransferase [Allorhizobium sonneratiae]